MLIVRSPREYRVPKGLNRRLTIALSIAVFCTISATQSPGGDERGAGITEDVTTLSLGGRLYDNHWNVVGRRPPDSRQPEFPKDVRTYNEKTWRCVACHGYDYLGRDGHLGTLSRSGKFTSLASAKGRDPAKLMDFLATGMHQKLTSVLSSDQLKALSMFVSKGQHSVAQLVDESGVARGISDRGKTIYVHSCVGCHQTDGTAVIYGEEGDVASLGWIARNRPAQALHKIRNGVPKADMLALRFMPLDQLSDLLAYLQQLDPKAR